jgi:hypothetical protein
MVKPVIALLATVFFLSVAARTEAQGKKMDIFYPFPAVMILELVPASKPIPGKSLDLEARLEGRIGVISNIRISFASSKDINVETPEIHLDALKEGEKRKFPVTAHWDPQKLTIDSVVSMVVEYSPDFTKLLETVSNTREYPDPWKRQNLVNKVKNGAAKGSRTIETTEYFPELDVDK